MTKVFAVLDAILMIQELWRLLILIIRFLILLSVETPETIFMVSLANINQMSVVISAVKHVQSLVHLTARPVVVGNSLIVWASELEAQNNTIWNKKNRRSAAR